MSVMDAHDLANELGELARELIGQVAQLRRELALATAERDEQATHIGELTDMVCAHEEALQALGWNPATREWKARVLT